MEATLIIIKAILEQEEAIIHHTRTIIHTRETTIRFKHAPLIAPNRLMDMPLQDQDFQAANIQDTGIGKAVITIRIT